MTRRDKVRGENRGLALSLTLGLLHGASAGAAEPSAVPPGQYIYEGGSGRLTVKGTPGKAQTFSIETVGANAHLCTLDGRLKGSEGLAGGPEDPSLFCTLTLAIQGADVTVTAVTEDTCRAYCGARGMFTGTYTLPTPECRPAAVTATRAKFKKRYDAKDYAGARTLLDGLVQRCLPVIRWDDVMWIRNDLALTQHHAGDDEGCRKTLEPLKDLTEGDPEDLGQTEPAYAETLQRIARATRTNLKLCTPAKTGR